MKYPVKLARFSGTTQVKSVAVVDGRILPFYPGLDSDIQESKFAVASANPANSPDIFCELSEEQVRRMKAMDDDLQWSKSLEIGKRQD